VLLEGKETFELEAQRRCLDANGASSLFGVSE
jgi:hypothetical protein